jgi:hypothetical protein
VTFPALLYRNWDRPGGGGRPPDGRDIGDEL